MKLTKSEVCVYIENEAQLEEARELLEKYGKSDKIDKGTFKIGKDAGNNNLYYSIPLDNWGLGCNLTPKITLQELETILKEQ